MTPTLGVDFGTLVSRLQGLTAITSIEAQARINQAHRRLVADALWLRTAIAVGTTVAGTDVYAIPAGTVEVFTVRVNKLRYERKTPDELDDLNNDPLSYAYGRPQRFFAQEFTSAGVLEVMLWPAPTITGQAITARGAVLPADMTNLAAAGAYPVVPPDFHEYLVDPFAFAETLSRDDERFNEADDKEAQCEAIVKKLRSRSLRRIGGGGIHRIQVIR